MKPYPIPRQFTRVAAIASVVLVVAITVIQSRRGEEDAVFTPMERGKADALVGELARCRTITPDDPVLLESCRHIWADNRQHFFLSTKSPQLPAALASSAPAVPVKGPDPVPPYGVDEGRVR
jgi:conjugative transfer region protein TrbK